MTTIKLRRGTAAQWITSNPILAQGEPGFETDTGKHKIGNGVTAWSGLKYYVDELDLSNAVAGEVSARDTAINNAVSNLINGAPTALDTLLEISAQLASDESAAASLLTAIGAETTRATTAEASKVPKWQATTAYTTGDVVMAPDGSIVKRLTSGTSGSSYTSANWQSVATVSGTQAATELNNTIGVQTGVVTATVVADGTTDDSAAILAAITTAAATGKWAKVPPGSTCRVDGITVTDLDVRLDLTGVTLIQSANAEVIKASSTPTNVLSVSAISSVSHTMPDSSSSTQSSQLTVSASTGYAKGDLVRIVSGDPIPNSNPSGGSFRPRLGEFARVGDVDSTHIYLAGPLRDIYSTNVKVYRVPDRVFETKGGVIDFNDALDGVNYPGQIAINGYRNLSVDSMRIPRALAAAITTQGCYGGFFNRVRSEHGRNIQPSQLGYGIVHLGSEHMTHIACQMDGFRHGFTTGGAFMGSNPVTDLFRFGRTANMTYIGCSADGCLGSGFDCHEEAINVNYVACNVNGSQAVGDASGSGFACRGRFVRYYGCHVRNGLTGWQIFSLYGPSCADVLIDGCSAVVQGSPVTVLGNIAGTAGGTAYSAGDVLRVRIRDAEQLTSLSGATQVTATRGQVAVDSAPAWTEGLVTYPPSAQGSQVDVFTTSGTWTKPSWAKSVEITCVGSGAGGGSGARQASGVTSSGGAGGGGGAVTTRTVPASLLGSTESVSVVAGGAGGAAKTTDTAAGTNGSAGGTCSFGTSSIKLLANGGSGGTGGQPSAAATSGSNGTGMFNGSSGGTGNAAAAGSAGGSANAGGAGGGAGGGMSATPAAFAGGNGGSMASTVGTPATAGTTGGGAGNSGNSQGNSGGPGGGGSGGGSNIAGVGGAGGAGGFPGGGGGGGGSSLNGSNSGAGGAGGDGLVVVVSYP